MCILMGKRLAAFLNSFLLLQVFGVTNAKIDFFKKNGFESSFTNWSVRFEKHKTLEILLLVDFLRIFKNVAFSKIFEIFESHQ